MADQQAVIKSIDDLAIGDLVEDSDRFLVWEAGSKVPTVILAPAMWDYLRAKMVAYPEEETFPTGGRVVLEKSNGTFVSIPLSAFPTGGGGGSPSPAVFSPFGGGIQNRFYPPFGLAFSSNPAATGLQPNKMQLQYFREAIPVDAIAIRVATAVAGGHIRLGLWDDDGPDGFAGTLIEQSGELATDTTGDKVFALAALKDYRTAPGCWVGALSDQVVICTGGAPHAPACERYGHTSLSGSGVGGFMDVDLTYGPLPSTCPTAYRFNLAGSPNMMAIRCGPKT